jgi:hypothetical protein
MGRTPFHRTQEQMLTPEVEIRPEVLAAERQLAALEGAYNAERDLMNQILGRIQMGKAMEEFCRTVGISQLAHIKENKLYKSLRGARDPENSARAEFSGSGSGRLVGTWAEFCELLDRSVDQVDRDIANLRAFGESALDAMRAVGIGYRELRDFRRLPEDEQAALRQIAEAGDKDGLMELAEALIAKQVKDKAALERRLEDSATSQKALERVLEDKSQTIDREQRRAAQLEERLKIRVAKADPGSVHQELTRELHARRAAVQVEAIPNLRLACEALEAHERETGTACHDLILGSLSVIARDLMELCDDYGLSWTQAGDVSIPDPLMSEFRRVESLSPEELEAEQRERADTYIRTALEGGWDEAGIRRAWPGMWEGSSYGQGSSTVGAGLPAHDSAAPTRFDS